MVSDINTGSCFQSFGTWISSILRMILRIADLKRKPRRFVSITPETINGTWPRRKAPGEMRS